MILDEQQQAAVDSRSDRLLVVAPAGSGKTRVLTERVVRLLEEGGACQRCRGAGCFDDRYGNVEMCSSCLGSGEGPCDPSRILALTFTRRAAAEMRSRISEEVGEAIASQLTITTFHGWAASVLRDWPALMGLRDGFTIYTEDERCDLLREIAGELRLKVPRRPEALLDDEKVGALYRRALVRANAIDYDGLESSLRIVLQAGEEVSERWDHVLVDEYQDTSAIQAAILTEFDPPNLFAVGDPWQAIYGFRGGCVENLRAFDEQLQLGTNYRSGRAIVRAAGAIDQREVLARRDGGLVECHLLPDTWDVEREVARRCSEAVPGDVMVLARTWRELEQLQKQLRVLCQLGKHDPWETDELRRIVAELRLSINPHDIAAMRALDLPNLAAIQAGQQELGFEARQGLDWVEHDLVEGWRDENGDDVEEFLAWYATRDRIAELDPEAVALLTVHAAKGLERPIVHVIGCDEGFWPRGDEEEERRLFYVAITRARDELHLYSSDVRQVWNQSRPAGPSSFFEMVRRSI